MAVKSELSEQKLGYIREFVNDKDPKEEYKLIQSIGTGTYGEVYKALRLRTKELAAVKIIKIDAKDDVRAILQEIQTLRDCKHSNIVQFFGSYFRNNKLWICMEFCGGFSMQDIYTNIRRPIEENCIAFVTRETLRGIEYMHKAGKIHRDIKGANILLTNDGEVKIADFGVAAQITQTIQRRNSFIGTPYWMAPEVAAVERKGGYDEKCDIWALGITAMEYAELQPPLFDLHPMRALRILGMRSYKPPTLRNKAAWSAKFHSFLKAALTKSEKKRPTAQALLRHELVTQPHLSRLLTLKLLELNRNPDRLAVTNAPTKPTSVMARCDEPPAVSSVIRPVELTIDSLVSAVSEDRKDRTLVHSVSPNLSDIGSKQEIRRKTSVSAQERPQPPEKMHMPWTDQTAVEYPAPVSSPGTTPVNSPVQTSTKSWMPAERITSTRQPTSQINGVVSNVHFSSVGPSQPKALLEEIRIMDELPTPLPAYVSAAPTATPAPKPSGNCGQLLASGKTPKTTAASAVTKPPLAPGVPVPVEALVQRRVASSAFPDVPTRIAVSDSSTVASSGSSGSSDSSCASASTSPRSSCSSLVMESVQAADAGLHAKLPNINGHECTDKSVLSSELNGKSTASQPTLSVIGPANNNTQSVAAPDYLTVLEPVVLQGSLEAQFLPIDGEAILLASQPNKSSAEPITPRSNARLNPSTSTTVAEPNSTCSISAADSESDRDSNTDDVSSCDELSVDEEDQITDHPTDDDSSFRGTVTTVDSVTSSSTNPNISTESIPHRLSHEGSLHKEHSKGSGFPSSSHMLLEGTPPFLSEEVESVAPRALVENADEWDLEIAHEKLLAADGLLNLNRSRPDSLSDRISEFGFRIHGSEGEEEEEEDDDEVDDYGFPDLNEENGIAIPDNIPSLETSLQCTQLTAFSKESNPVLDFDLPNQLNAVANTHMNGSPKNQVPITVASDVKCPDKALPKDNVQPDTSQEFFPDKSGEELMSLLRQLKFAQKFAWLSGSSVPPTTLSALANIQSTKISLNGCTEPLRLNVNELGNKDCPDRDVPASNVIKSDYSHRLINSVSRVHSESPSHSPNGTEMRTLFPGSAKPIQMVSDVVAFTVNGMESNEECFPEEMEISTLEAPGPEVAAFPVSPEPPAWATSLLLEDVSAIDSDRSVHVSPVLTEPEQKVCKSISFEPSDESGMQLLAPSIDQPLEAAQTLERPAATARLSEIMGEELESECGAEQTGDQIEFIPDEPPADVLEAQLVFLDIHVADEVTPVVHEPEYSISTAESCDVIREPSDISVHSQATTDNILASIPPQVTLRDDISVTSSPEPQASEVTLQELQSVEVDPDVPCSTRTQASDSMTERRTSFSRTYPPRPEVNGSHQIISKALISFGQITSHPLTRAAHLRESDTSQPHSGSSGSRSSRFSMIELSHVNERPLHASCSALPPTPQVHMGACFSLVFEGCPLKINSTATWINPMNNGQIILFGTNDGIYFLSLKDLADSSLELLFPRRCLWLSVVRDTMMSLSGRHPQLYSHNLISLMKLKSQGHPMNGKLSRLSSLFPRRFSPSQKIPETKGCRRVSVTRSPFNGAKYLCAAIGNEILVMEWFNTISSFIKIKRVLVPDMPSPLLTFDLFIVKERPLPLVCLGVYRHHSRRGRENQRYRLHLVDLNTCAPFSPASDVHTSPGPLAFATDQPCDIKSCKANGEQGSNQTVNDRSSGNDLRKLKQKLEYENRNNFFSPEDMLPVVEAVQLEHNTILVCLQDCAKVINLNGRIKSSRHRATTLDFNGNMAESVVCLRDSILVFHPNGLLGKSFTGELTQEIHDEKHIYRLLGCDRNIIVESRPADDPMSNSNVYILAGHTDSCTQ